MAAPAIAANLVVLALAGLGTTTWLVQLLALGMACALVGASRLRPSWIRGRGAALRIALFCLVGIGAPLVGNASVVEAGPQRWLFLGPLGIYMAPLLLPALLLACSELVCRRTEQGRLASVSILVASLLLAIQPDASQVAALSAGWVVILVRGRWNGLGAISTVFVVGAITLWAFSRPDPLEPVPHVEGVFALAFEASLGAGVGVLLGAAGLIAGLSLSSVRGPAWPSAVAAYYFVLYICSVAGLTPAPLIGFGAGPILGYGLVVALDGWMGARSSAPSENPSPSIS